MSANNNRKTVKTTLATGLILGGIMLAGLGSVGCDKLPDQIAAIQSRLHVDGGQGADSDKADVRSRINLFFNHNETFLTDAAA